MSALLSLDDPEDFGETLRLLRRLAGVTQQELGAAIGTSAGRIGKYERGINPPNLPTAIKLLKILGYRLAIEPIPVQESTER